MRIISGSRRGRKIDPPQGLTARPTTDFAKEGLFNVLANRVEMESLDVLDLFGGTGSIGYEFASRGCRTVTTVEKNRLHAAFIRKMTDVLGFENMEVIQGDVFKYVKSCRRKYDLIFADPPYQMEELDSLPDMIMVGHLLKEGGLFVLEHGPKKDFSEHRYFVEHRHYGNVNFSFFEPAGDGKEMP